MALQADTSKPNQMSNRAILIEANEAFSQGDYERFLTYCTDDTKWVYVGDRTIIGKEALRQYLATAYEESTFSIERYIEDGNYLTALGAITLKDKEGKLVNYSVCDVWTFREGKLAELKAFVIPD